MANHGYDDIKKDEIIGKALLSGLAVLALGGASHSVINSQKKANLQRELDEINNQLAIEYNKFFLFRDQDKIQQLEERKKIIQENLNKI